MPASGHVNPSAPLVRELIHRGFDVEFYATEQFRRLAESLGAEFRAYPKDTISSAVIAKATIEGGSTKVVQRLLESTPTLLEFLQSQLHEDSPDAVMFDSNALWGRMLATSLDRPAISLMTTMFVGSATLRALRARELLSAVRECPTRGELTILPIPEWMQAPDPRRDASCHCVGPSIEAAARTEDSDPDLEAVLSAADPVVVVSLGTLHAGGQDFFRSCIEA